MGDLQHLVDGLKEVENDLVKCMKCGFCQNVCPMYATTQKEFDVSRGKIALLSNMASKMLEDADGMADRLDRCLLCGACQANCPSNTPTINLFLRARALLAEYRGLSPVKKLIFRTLLPNPKGFDLALKVGSKFQGLMLRKVKDSTQGTVSAPLLKGMIGNRHIVPLPTTSLHAKYGHMDTPAGKSGIKVAFFPGCMADRMYVNMGEACIKVLQYHGVGIFFPGNFSCCGIPSLASGDTKGFESQVRQNLAALAGHEFDYLLTPCGSCTSTIVEHWPHLGTFTEAEREQLKAIAAKTMDINAFLVDVIGVKPAAQPDADATPVTFHDPCHLKKALHISSQPRDLIRANPKYTIVEMSESDRCCGCGGSFTLFHYDLSQKIGQVKRDMIVETGAPIVATGCPACMMQLTDNLSRNGDKVKVKHSIELYAESLN